MPIKQYLSIHHCTQLLTTIILFSVHINLTILVSPMTLITVFVFLVLEYFIWHKVFKVHPYCSVYQDFLPFKGHYYSIYIYPVFIHSSVDGHLGCFQLLAFVNNASKNMRYKHLFKSLLLISLDIYSEVE